MDLSGACVEDFEGKINKSKLKLVLTNGKIQGYDWVFINIVINSLSNCCRDEGFHSITLFFAVLVLLGRRGAVLVTLMEQDALHSSSL